MSTNPNSSVYIGNLDARVSERVLYDIMIQAGRVIHLHVPKDRETEKPRGYAFAEYESEEIADYAVRIFSGLVVLYNKTLKFAISGQYKLSSNTTRSNRFSVNRTNLPPRVSGLGSHSRKHRSHHDGKSFEYGRRPAFGSVFNKIDRSRPRYSSRHPVHYTPY